VHCPRARAVARTDREAVAELCSDAWITEAQSASEATLDMFEVLDYGDEWLACGVADWLPAVQSAPSRKMAVAASVVLFTLQVEAQRNP
jgi:hypothetical protein